MTQPDPADLIDHWAGIAPGSPLDAIRANRADARTHAEASYRALLRPARPGGVSVSERLALAAYVAGLHRAPEATAHYAGLLREQAGAEQAGAERAGAAWAEAVAQAVAETAAAGPRGHFPPGPLSAEDSPAPGFALSATTAAALGPQLAAGLAHAHLLVLHPRDAAPAGLAALRAAGWTADAIVTLSQLVAFLTFQLRVAAGLRVLAATP